ncbi:CCR4-NOT transcriptional complex subunit [Psilocybe cubensis]|uniref:CCR4-NOT transcriptional complex subunit n=2 Tax=Psilocybe cubensis TaxID=181762 RepID=A0ACB8H195_PSICU|nr:CCR4-NOT transcriptional complex subunit [Psilocybe cubensis]KAH9481606.1 CCR4-NOT transcriptional complex subunit [Psilocybe cubensis]
MTSPYPQTTSPPHWESRNGYVPPPRFQQLRAQDSLQQLQLQYNQQQQLLQQQQQQFELAQNQLHAQGQSPYQRQSVLYQHPPSPSNNNFVQQVPSAPPTPDMAHSRSSSFFAFNRNKQSVDGQPNVHQRPMSTIGNTGSATIPTQQYLPPSTNSFPPQGPAPGPSRQSQPPPQNVPPSQYGIQQQQQLAQPQPQPQPQHLPPQQPQQQQPSSPSFSGGQPSPNQFTPQPPMPQSPPPPAPAPQQSQRPQAQPQQSNAPNPSRTSNASQPTTLARSPSVGGAQNNPQPPAPPPLHPEIRSVVQLSIAHAHKIYFSGPLVRRLERQGDGQRPHKDEGWTDVWAQLGGTTLSIWSMKEIQEANKQGKEVPPSYINVTDAFIQVVGSVTVPATPTTPAKRYSNVLTLNTAGSNLLLFSCPSTAALLSWAAALRLSAWEKSRLEEIYTAHLIRITLSAARDIPTTLVRGKMEGYARVRIAGQTDWKRVWLVVQEGTEGSGKVEGAEQGAISGPPQGTLVKKKRMSNLFSRDSNPSNSTIPTKAMISMFPGPKPKDRKKALMTVFNVTQAFGVYPERPELINRSTLMKVEGTFGDDDMAGSLRTREGWVLIMPELENGVGQAAEMLKWIVGLHDAFELYGRPEAWTWDPRDPVSLMFGYPVGAQKENLFLDRELVENMDPRDDRTSVIRAEMKKLLQANLRPAVQVVQPNPRAMTESPPIMPSVGSATAVAKSASPPPQQAPNAGPQLPPLSFGANTSTNTTESRERTLTPITERSNSNMTTTRTLSLDVPSGLNTGHSPITSSPLNDQSLQLGGITESSSSGSNNLPNPVNNASIKSPDSSEQIAQSSQPTSSSGLNQQGQTVSASPSTNTMSTQFSSAVGTLPSVDSVADNSLSSLATSAPVDSPRPPANVGFDAHARSPPASPLPNFSSTIGKVQQPLSPTSLDEARAKSQAMNRQADGPRTSPQPSGNTAHLRTTSPSNQQEHQRQSFAANATRSSPTDEPNDFINEAGALYYMRESGVGNSGNVQQRERQQEDLDEDESSSSSDSLANKATAAKPSQSQQQIGDGTSAARSPTTFVHANTVTPSASSPKMSHTAPMSPIGRLSPSRSNLGRKPSGARAQAVGRSYNRAESISSQTVTETDESMSKHQKQESNTSDLAYDDANGEALAALTYLDIADSQDIAAATSTVAPLTPPLPKVEPLNLRGADRNSATSPLPGTQSGEAVPYKSSFAPSNKAAERKLKAQAQQAAQHAATHKPGRANGKRKSKTAGAWESSDEEEEEEEEEDDDDDDVDSDSQQRRGPQSSSSQSQGMSSSSNSLRPLQTQGQGPVGQQHEYQDSPQTPSHLRPARNLPQIPGNRMTGDNFHHPQPQAAPRRLISDQYTGDGSRRTFYDDGTPIRTQAEFPQPGAARQTVWSQVLDPGHAPGRVPQPEQAAPVRDTFVQLEPSETMTKAFTPQGLLSAGLQDKEDRSARRQEELARESGASLINVPNKPPPPQTGLLGAITAHERERKREGGVGAALTEREREKRLAEERQRRFDDHQRQQLDQMQQGGSMYGGQFGFNPMMANPMMMGMNPMMAMNPMMTGNAMNPMMTGAGGMGQMNPMMTGQMGFPGMMGGFNPHLFAAQQAAQAYQQAMMAFSVAGSQIGGDGGGATGAGAGAGTGSAQITPNMTGMNPAMGAGSMAGFDPRMSMMGMPMMGMGMGMNMGMGAPSMSPMGMQATGMSSFDARSSPGIANNNTGNSNDGGLLPPQFSSRTSSPASRGSPLARGGPETADRGRPSRPTSPK